MSLITNNLASSLPHIDPVDVGSLNFASLDTLSRSQLSQLCELAAENLRHATAAKDAAEQMLAVANDSYLRKATGGKIGRTSVQAKLARAARGSVTAHPGHTPSARRAVARTQQSSRH